MSFNLSTETNPDDVPWLVKQLLHSYWGWWLDEERIRAGLKSSLCFWIHRRDGSGAAPVAFARVVTDKTMFSSVVDLFVVEDHQKEGLGRMLMEAINAHPDVKRTVCILATRDAEGFYARFGFERVNDPVLIRNPS